MSEIDLETGIDIDWTPPGPGVWEHDASHSPPGPTPLFQRLSSRSAEDGYRWAFETFGGPLDTIQFRFVNGMAYRRVVPLVGADRSGPPPPAPILWLAARLHPTFRRRERIARRAFESTSFLGQLERWERAERQEWIDANLSFQREDLAQLDDEALAEHLERLLAHLLRGWTRHHQLHATDMGPIGDLLAHTNRWGLDPVAVMAQLRGASPATVEAADHAASIADALREAGVDPATVTSLDQVRAAGPEAAARLDAYLERFGLRIVTSYDLEGLTVEELPGGTVAMIRAAGATGADRPDTVASVSDRSAGADRPPGEELRKAIPAEDREAFDRLLANARLAYGLRDDNGPLTAEWPLGLARRAFREAGHRLASRGRIAEPERVFELDGPELVEVLRGADSPTSDELDARADLRRRQRTLEAPAILGEVHPDPDPGLLPPGLRRMVETVTTAVELLEPKPTGRESLSGLGIGDRVVVGRARIVDRPEEVLQTIEDGDILVAAWTAPTYNAVLAAVSAVVVQEGGLLCHAAVMARELGLSAVIGATDAMTAIGEGDRIEVDPAAGTVRVLERG